MTAPQSEDVVIPLSKGKLVPFVLGGAAFAALGLGLYLNPDQISRRPPLFLKAVGVVCAGFFGSIAVQAAAKLFSTAPGLIIDSEGIVDNSSGVAVGPIPWSDIKRIGISTSEERRFITIEVRDPQKYIQRGNLVKRVLRGQNMKYFGGPIHISADTLRIDFDELVKVIKAARAQHKRAPLRKNGAGPV